MTTFLLIFLLVTLLFAVIACDECRTLGRRIDALEDRLAEVVDDQVAHERQHDADTHAAYLRDRAQAPTRRGQDLPTTTRDPHLQVVKGDTSDPTFGGAS